MDEEIVNNDSKWWKQYFKIKQPPPERGVVYPIFDLILAHRIIKPLIDKYEDEIQSWHFHRRWKKDNDGHLFSFNFYTPESTKDKILEELKENNSFKIMKDLKLILDFNCEEKPPEENGSYKWDNWPPSVNKNYPLFVHSISKMWLDLIDEIKNYIPASNIDPQTYEELQLYYQQIEANINHEWLYRGAQFTYHPISIIFGYQPTIIDHSQMKGYLMSL